MLEGCPPPRARLSTEGDVGGALGSRFVLCKCGGRGWKRCWSPAHAFALGAADTRTGDPEPGEGWAAAWGGGAASSAENVATSERFYTSRRFCGESKRFCVQLHLFCFLCFGLTSLSQETTQRKSVCFLNSASINSNLQSCSGLYKDLLIKTFPKY